MGTIFAEDLDDDLVRRFNLLAVEKYGMRGKKTAIEDAIIDWIVKAESGAGPSGPRGPSSVRAVDKI